MLFWTGEAIDVWGYVRLAAQLRLRDQNAGIHTYFVYLLLNSTNIDQFVKIVPEKTQTKQIALSFFFTVSIDQNVICFVPFYIMYVFFMTLHIKFAYSTYRIAIRYLTLNNVLRKWKAHRKLNIFPLFSLPFFVFRSFACVPFHFIRLIFWLRILLWIIENALCGEKWNQPIDHRCAFTGSDLMLWPALIKVNTINSVFLF